MKVLILTLILSLFSFNSYSKENDKNIVIDYSKYNLSGIFKKEIFREDYYWLWEFKIYDNKIYNIYYGDMARGNPDVFPDGEYTLETYNNSKIKINVKDGEVLNFILLSDGEEFKRKEERIAEDDTCFISYYIINWQNASNPENIKYYEVENNDIYKLYDFYYMFFYKDKNKIFISKGDNHYSDKMYLGDFYFKFYDNYLIPINIDMEKNFDLYIKNCVLIDYNKEKINL